MDTQSTLYRKPAHPSIQRSKQRNSNLPLREDGVPKASQEIQLLQHVQVHVLLLVGFAQEPSVRCLYHLSLLHSLSLEIQTTL